MPKMEDLAHYLCTIEIAPGMHMHGYLMCRPEEGHENTEALIAGMLDKAEKLDIISSPIIGIALTTRFTRDVEKLREIVVRYVPPAEELMKKATNYHVAAWIMPAGLPDDKWLMAQH